MTNEEFQKLIIEKLSNMDAKMSSLEKKLDAVNEQTANLLEFKIEVKENLKDLNAKLDTLIEDNKSIYGMLGEHEIAIRTLRRRPV